MTASRTRARITPNVPLITFGELAKLISDRGWDALGTATAAALIASQEVPGAKVVSIKETFTVWHVGAVMLAALAKADRIPNPIPETINNISLPDIGELTLRAMGLEAEGRIRPVDVQDRIRQLQLLKVRLVNTQFTLQGDSIHPTARTCFLLGVDDLTSNSLSSPFDPLFEEKYGCSAQEYCAILFALWTHSLENTTLRADRLLSNSVAPERLTEVLRKIIRSLSIPVIEIEKAINEKFGSYEAESLVQAFFGIFPFVELRTDWYLTAPHPYLLSQVSTGVLFKALELAREKARELGHSRPETNEQSEWMGKRFEALVGHILKEKRGATKVAEEFLYLHRQTDKSSDFVLFEGEPGSETAVIIETKLRRLSPPAFFAFDHDAVKGQLEGPISDTISQIIKFLHALEKGSEENKLDPATEALSRRILSCKKIFLLGVFAAMPPVFCSEENRDFITEGIKRSLSPQVWDWLQSKRSWIFGWHVLDFRELSAFWAVASDRSLFRELVDYTSQPDFGRFLTEAGIITPFDDWILKRARRSGEPKHLGKLFNAYGRLTDFACQLLFGRLPTPEEEELARAECELRDG